MPMVGSHAGVEVGRNKDRFVKVNPIFGGHFAEISAFGSIRSPLIQSMVA